MIQFINIDIYMKNIDEKEKKLKDTLKKLGEINIQHNEELDKVAILKDQKNQLEIEKNELEKKYKNLSDEHGNLQVKIKQMMVEKKDDRMKRLAFDEKIDELNQETDILIDEIDKWQM